MDDAADADARRREQLVCVAPEVLVLGQPHTPASNAYAFGALCWQMYAGRLPWAELRAAQLMQTLAAQTTIPASLPGCPPEFQVSPGGCKCCLRWWRCCCPPARGCRVATP